MIVIRIHVDNTKGLPVIRLRYLYVRADLKELGKTMMISPDFRRSSLFNANNVPEHVAQTTVIPNLEGKSPRVW